MILGAVAGLMVGLTSVGAGSIVVVVLLILYPRLKASSLVGTDLTQAIPLVAAAALGHILFGSFSLAIATSLLVGAIPGTYIGAHISSRAPGGIIRRVLAVVLLASSLKLLGVPDAVVAAHGARWRSCSPSWPGGSSGTGSSGSRRSRRRASALPDLGTLSPGDDGLPEHDTSAP